MTDIERLLSGTRPYTAVNTYTSRGWVVYRAGKSVTDGLDQGSAVVLAERLNNEHQASCLPTEGVEDA